MKPRKPKRVVIGMGAGTAGYRNGWFWFKDGDCGLKNILNFVKDKKWSGRRVRLVAEVL